MAIKVLILGGTGEGRWLSERLADDARFLTLLSFAGRTVSVQRSVASEGIAQRVGGFGGAAGLSAFLRDGSYGALVDTTHPYAARISANAVAAAQATGTPLLRLTRPAWQAEPGDRWREVLNMDEAARALGHAPRRVFLTIGRQEVLAFEQAPQHDYLIRAIDAFETALPHARVLLARGPFSYDQERALLERERIALLVSKNAGTDATYPKIAAARALGLEVIMVARPAVPAAEETASLEGVLAWLERIHGASRSLRGE